MDLHFDAAVFDLDGVVTRTATLHFEAWKATFDGLLAQRDEEPFTRDDYLAEVDGKPRLDGIRSFLKARGLPAEEATVQAIADEKNARFQTLLATEGPDVYPGALALLQSLRSAGIRLALASSSRNAASIVEAAGLHTLFDARIDGTTSIELGLRGKPAPDLFLAAATAVGASPGRCVLFEDAVSGVAAGIAGGFGLVVGVDRGGNHLALRQAGADLVVQGLRELDLAAIDDWFFQAEERRPSALARAEELLRRLDGRRPAVFLDYDGTLAPIVARPELAVMAKEVREALEFASTRLPVVVVSGRRLEDVVRLVGLPALHYAGSHGFEIRGPASSFEMRPDLRDAVHDAAAELAALPGRFPGVLVEDKGFALAVHFRLADPEAVPAIEAAVDVARAAHGLRKTHGKMIFELRPDIDWDKGHAVRWLVEKLDLEDAMPIYVGDDVTDEDAFRDLKAGGIGILVTDRPRPTLAGWSLQDPAEVGFFLRMIANFASREDASWLGEAP